MLLTVAEYLGIAAFSASGYYIARRSGLDWLGIYIAAFLTALGGGIVRDILINRPPWSLTHSTPIYLVLGITTALLFLHRFQEHDFRSKPLFVLVDAVGMSSFALSGALTTLEYTEFTLAGVTAMAFTTAIGGGIARDLLINKIPYVLHGGFYGIIALGLGIAVYVLHTLNGLDTLTLIGLFFVGVALRMIAYARDWHLPKG
jgi:uncharacterized membrane protein YeiH